MKDGRRVLAAAKQAARLMLRKGSLPWSMSHDDAAQIGALALLEADPLPEHDGLYFRVAYRGIVDHLRRVGGRTDRPWQPRNGAEWTIGDGALRDLDFDLWSGTREWCPERILIAQQTLERMRAGGRAAVVDAVANADTQAEAAQQMGLTPTRVCQVLRAAREAAEA